MISQQFRFHGHNAMRFVFGRGQTVRAAGLSLRYVANPRRSSYRAAVVVSRKVHKSAVVRNRIRRRIYEVIRLSNVDQPYDLMFTVFDASYATADAAKLKHDVLALLVKARLTTPVV